MKSFTGWMGMIFRKLGLRGVVPTGAMPPDNSERFDIKRQPEQYAEFVDSRRS